MAVETVPDGMNVQANRQPAVLGTVIITWLLLLLAFGGRLWCRRLLRTSMRLDDYLIIPAVIFATAQSIVILGYMIPNNMGRHIFTIAPEHRDRVRLHFRIGIFILQQEWALGILSVKFSILALYWRLFSKNNIVRYQIMFWTVIVSCWGIEYTVIKLTTCLPIRSSWDSSVEKICAFSLVDVVFANGVINTITDTALLFIPLPAIWSLQLVMKQKIGLTGIFLLGGLCTAASITRLVYIKQDLVLDTTYDDVTWQLTWTTTWTILELNLAVICGCLPQLRPLLHPHRNSTVPTEQTRFSTLRDPTLMTIGSMDSTRPVNRPTTDSDMEEGHGRGLAHADIKMQSLADGSGSESDEVDRVQAGRNSRWNVTVVHDFKVANERGEAKGSRNESDAFGPK